MACDGPCKEFSIIKSQAAFDDIMHRLKDKYQIERPGSINGYGIEKEWQDNWDKDEAVLRETLASLFWHSDAADF